MKLKPKHYLLIVLFDAVLIYFVVLVPFVLGGLWTTGGMHAAIPNGQPEPYCYGYEIIFNDQRPVDGVAQVYCLGWPTTR